MRRSLVYRTPWFRWQGILVLNLVKFCAGRTRTLMSSMSRVSVDSIFMFLFFSLGIFFFFFFYRCPWISALSSEANLSTSKAPALQIFPSYYCQYGFGCLGGSWTSHSDRLSTSHSDSHIKLYST